MGNERVVNTSNSIYQRRNNVAGIFPPEIPMGDPGPDNVEDDQDDREEYSEDRIGNSEIDLGDECTMPKEPDPFTILMGTLARIERKVDALLSHMERSHV